jgi:hypothetical protein
MVTYDKPHPPRAHNDFNSSLDGICPLLRDNIAVCHHNICRLESIRQALHLCVKNYDQCSIYRKRTLEQ